MREEDVDFSHLSKWLTDHRVLEFYEGRDAPVSMDEARTAFSPRTMQAEGTTPCFIELDGEPIGYIQYYLNDEPGTWGIDLFLGVPELWGQGLGAQAIRAMLEFLFSQEAARAVTVDPHATNERAIRCYEKCGFRKVRILERSEWHEGSYRDCWLMEATR